MLLTDDLSNPLSNGRVRTREPLGRKKSLSNYQRDAVVESKSLLAERTTWIQWRKKPLGMFQSRI